MKNQQPVSIIVSSVLLFYSLFTLSARAEIYIVPVNFETISAGLDSVVDGDTLFVLPGEYRENIDFDGKAVAVIGIPGLTTLDGGGEGPCVSFTSGEDMSSLLAGFTLINGDAGEGRGGGIRIERSTPLVVLNSIHDCSANQGGAISIVGAGGLIPANVYRNVIYDNESAGAGGAIYIGALTPALLINNTIVQNRSGAEGAAVYSDNGIAVFVTNCIIANNNSAGGGGALYRNGMFAPMVTTRYNDVWENEGGNYGRIDAGEGSISEDPLFLDPEQHLYSLQEESPCIDAGDPNGLPDFDGSRADIGALSALNLPGGEPVIVEPDSLDFGLIEAGADSTRILTLTNPNDVAIKAVVFAVPPTVFEVSDSLVEIDADSEVVVSVTFMPPDAGDYTETLTVLTLTRVEFADTIEFDIPIATLMLPMHGTATPVHVAEQGAGPVKYDLMDCYPNPFNSSVVIRVTTPEAGRVKIVVNDFLGRTVAQLFEGQLPAGRSSHEWKPGDLPSGAYSVNLIKDSDVINRQVYYLK